MGNLFQKSRKYLNTKYQISPLSESEVALERWFHSRYGQYILQHEQQGLAHVMPDAGAHRMMHLGVTPEQLIAGDFNHIHSFSLGASIENPGDSTTIADYDTLPLPSETIDTVLLHHALEFSVSPHEVLKEASRVLKPCGHMVLVVFNPVSFFGLSKWMTRLFSSHQIWRYHSLRQGRILDWLRLLNIQPVKLASGCFSWPSRWSDTDKKERLFDRLGQKYCLPCGAYYIVVARKYVAKPTLLAPLKWQSIRLPVTPAVKNKSVLDKGTVDTADVTRNSVN